MRSMFSSIASLLAMLVIGCNTVDPDECWVNTSGGFGGGGTIPIGNGVGATSSGDFLTPPPGGPLAADGTPNPCVGDSSTDSVGADAGPSGEEIMQQYLEDASPAGGVVCTNADDCYTKCAAESKYCSHMSYHPYKAGLFGDLYDCRDSFPKASWGGSYTCLFRYPNGDACIFAFAAKLGPIKFPAPPPVCMYKSN
jgi:hypothetical protein